jgi:hypothetical protein
MPDLIKELQRELRRAGLGDFFESIRGALAEKGALLLDPRSSSRRGAAHIFECGVGTMGDGSEPKGSLRSAAYSDGFVELGRAEIRVYGRGAGVEFTIEPASLFSAVLYPLLSDPDLPFAEGEIRCDLELLGELADLLADLRSRVCRALELEKKKVKKVFLSRCETLASEDPADLEMPEGGREYERGWIEGFREALSRLSSFARRID